VEQLEAHGQVVVLQDRLIVVHQSQLRVWGKRTDRTHRVSTEHILGQSTCRHNPLVTFSHYSADSDIFFLHYQLCYTD
jgi:hypothetical protein